MTERTGLGPLELAVLRSVSATAGLSGARCRTTTTLDYLEAVEGIGLVDGGLYRGGKQPPLDPARALRTIEALLEDETIPDGDLEQMIGLPRCRPAAPCRGTSRGCMPDEMLGSCRAAASRGNSHLRCQPW